MSDAPIRVLVVDDDVFTAELTGLVLESVGYEIVIAEGGPDALEKMEDDPTFKLVVSDMNMPFMDGAELFAELRGAGRNQPFILLTGQDAEALRDAHPGIDAVLAKDENFQEILPELACKLLAGVR